MWPGGTSSANNPEDGTFRGDDESVVAPGSGGTASVDVSGYISDDDRAPDYPPAQVVLSIGIDEEPYVVTDGGLPDWVLMAGMQRILDTIRQAEQSDTWEIIRNGDDEE